MIQEIIESKGYKRYSRNNYHLSLMSLVSIFTSKTLYFFTSKQSFSVKFILDHVLSFIFLHSCMINVCGVEYSSTDNI